MNFVPKVIPINELKNTGNISRICKESNATHLRYNYEK